MKPLLVAACRTRLHDAAPMTQCSGSRRTPLGGHASPWMLWVEVKCPVCKQMLPVTREANFIVPVHEAVNAVGEDGRSL